MSPVRIWKGGGVVFGEDHATAISCRWLDVYIATISEAEGAVHRYNASSSFIVVATADSLCGWSWEKVGAA